MTGHLAGIEPWTFEQDFGEAVFIPAGCPHQVRNMKVVPDTFYLNTCYRISIKLFECPFFTQWFPFGPAL
jgi:hypothetical protein